MEGQDGKTLLSQGGSMDLHLHYISMLKPEHCVSEVWVLHRYLYDGKGSKDDSPTRTSDDLDCF